MATDPRAAALIVAAGSGRRMGQPTAKQYLPLGGHPVLMHTLRLFSDCSWIGPICLVVPPDDTDFCRRSILEPLRIGGQVQMVAGGDSRQESVFNGLQAMAPYKGLVAIHDGVRPFASENRLQQCIQKARASGACIVALPVTDTVKQASTGHQIERTLDRQQLWLAQTPQVFDFEMICRAHRRARREGYRASDDAMLVERIGKTVGIVPGSPFNLKITLPEHLILAEAILHARFRLPRP